MSFNPKVSELKKVLAKDVSKKTLQKIAQKATDATTAIPFFFKHNFQFADGKEGPLFIAGKIKQFKNELKTLKSADEMYGLVYVKMSDKGVPTTVFSPVRGKLGTKTSILTKAMKTAFTNSWANFEVGAEIDEKAAEAAETAADSLEDIEVANDASDAPSSEAAPTTEASETKEAPKAEDSKTDATKEAPKAGGGKLDKFKTDVEALEALLEAMKGNQDAAKHSEMDAEFKKLVGGIKGEKK